MALSRLEEWKGRIIAYLGGGGISLYSDSVAANAEPAAELAAHSQEFFTAQLFSGLGLFFVGCRLIFDLYVFLDERRFKREQLKLEAQALKEQEQNG